MIALLHKTAQHPAKLRDMVQKANVFQALVLYTCVCPVD